MSKTLAFFLAVSVAAGCASDEEVDEVNTLVVSALQSTFAPGTYSGETAAGTRCEARVSHGTGAPREFTLELSYDGDTSLATFYANGGRTLTIEGGAGNRTDVKAKAGGDEPHVWELRAEESFGGDLFTFIEVKETRGEASTSRRCLDLTKN
jgi:hypothetical protein